VGLITAADALLFGSPYDPDERGHEAWQCAGSPSRLIPMLVFHGSDDIVVNPVNGDQVVQQFLQTNDWGDDRRDDDSIAYRATDTQYATVPGGHDYRVDSYVYGGVLVGQKYTVYGMNHAWSGGAPGWPFSDPCGPDATTITWNFFTAYHR